MLSPRDFYQHGYEVGIGGETYYCMQLLIGPGETVYKLSDLPPEVIKQLDDIKHNPAIKERLQAEIKTLEIQKEAIKAVDTATKSRPDGPYMAAEMRYYDKSIELIKKIINQL